MNTDDYVSYPIALALKKAGFDLEVNHVYDKNGELWEEGMNENAECDYTAYFNYNKSGYIEVSASAPTLAQAQKWLRDIFLLHVGANPALPTRKWQFYIDDLNQQINPYDGELMTRWDDDMQEKADEHLHDTYESALSAGIAAALELIEEKGE